MIATNSICTPTVTISKSGERCRSRQDKRAHTEWETPLGFGCDATASKGDEVRYYKTEDIHAHFLHDGDTLLTLVRCLHVPDGSRTRVTTVADA